jgi:hypothetical protein
MAQSVRRIARVVLPLLALALLIPACWNTSSLDRLFGAPGGSGGDGGFDPGIGGGLTLRDLFAGARLLREKPTVLRVAPVDKQKDVSIKTPIVIEFSESMFENSVRTGVSLFQNGSTTATTTVLTMFQGDSVAVLIPQVDLLPNTGYEIVIAGSVTDLQGDAIDVGSSGGGTGVSDLRFSFTTIASTGDPDFDVIFASPGQQAAEVPRGSESIILFSEPINTGTSGGGINAPGNVVVTRDGATLVPGVDFVMSTFPTANPRGLQIVFTTLAAADTDVGIGLDSDVQSADGQEALNKGNGVDLEFTTQNTSIPADAIFPQATPPPGFDGAVSTVHLHDFATDVDLTSDGQLPDSTTLIFFDKQQQNALLFNVASADPTSFISDLEPKQPPALLDGDVLVAAFVERRGFRSEVSVFETIAKDTVGPALLSMGPPAIGSALLVTQVNDPVLHGFMSEPCAGVQVDFGGTAVPPIPDFNSVEFTVGQSTVTDDFFVTGPTEDAPLPAQLEPSTAFSMIVADVLGNTTVFVGTVGHQTAGKVGATVGSPDGVSALYVAGFFGDTFLPIAFGGAVLLDSFPPDPGGANQIARGFGTSGGLVRFTDFDLQQVAPNPGDKITVTIVAQRGPSATIFGPVTFAGVDKPSAAAPRAILARLDPDPSIDLTNPAQCDILGESANSPAEAGSGFTRDDVPATPELERTAPFVPNPTTADNKIDLPLNQLQAFAVGEKFNFGGVQQRFTSSEPFTAENDSSGGVPRGKLRVADFGNRTAFGVVTHPHLLHSVAFDDAAVSSGGALGLVGSENPAEQFRQLRLLCRLPGFVDSVAVAAANAFTNLGGTSRTGNVLLPQNFLDNDTPGASTMEDSPLELLLQPDLIDPASAVDPARLIRNLRLELFVQDKLVTGTATPSSAFTRERFVFADPTVASSDTATLQAIPVVTPVSTTHPPQFSWPEVTQGEGMHQLTLVSALKAQTWTIYVPAQSGGGTISMQLPDLSPAGGLPDGVVGVDFSNPGLFKVFVESFDFDPGLIFSPGSAVQYSFDPQSWFQSDLERECLRSSRSDTNVTVLTN